MATLDWEAKNPSLRKNGKMCKLRRDMMLEYRRANNVLYFSTSKNYGRFLNKNSSNKKHDNSQRQMDTEAPGQARHSFWPEEPLDAIEAAGRGLEAFVVGAHPCASQPMYEDSLNRSFLVVCCTGQLRPEMAAGSGRSTGSSAGSTVAGAWENPGIGIC